jgi:hypothetical protein
MRQGERARRPARFAPNTPGASRSPIARLLAPAAKMAAIQARSSAHDGAARFITLNASQRLASVHSKGTLSFGAY